MQMPPEDFMATVTLEVAAAAIQVQLPIQELAAAVVVLAQLDLMMLCKL